MCSNKALSKLANGKAKFKPTGSWRTLCIFAYGPNSAQLEAVKYRTHISTLAHTHTFAHGSGLQQRLRTEPTDFGKWSEICATVSAAGPDKPDVWPPKAQLKAKCQLMHLQFNTHTITHTHVHN